MKKFLERISKLFEVKSLITLGTVGVFLYLSAMGKIETQSFMTVLSTLIAFYFGTQAQKNANAKPDASQVNSQSEKVVTEDVCDGF